jgi:hypothetical protein
VVLPPIRKTFTKLKAIFIHFEDKSRNLCKLTPHSIAKLVDTAKSGLIWAANKAQSQHNFARHIKQGCIFFNDL